MGLATFLRRLFHHGGRFLAQLKEQCVVVAGDVGGEQFHALSGFEQRSEHLEETVVDLSMLGERLHQERVVTHFSPFKRKEIIKQEQNFKILAAKPAKPAKRNSEK
uniref:(northern house mosquito) hypothetical protein n=1 Tax=Culex pipiens TaxID=7175 RepID=A0A8D8CK25_CULPI